ncbi:MAG: methylated-DNA--[protein]-cysteine S-methyltransferase [Lachnospiraceae bacterium]
MQYISEYDSPLGKITLASDEKGLFGLWFEGQKYFGRFLDDKCEKKETEAIRSARQWLDVYFSGREPSFLPPLDRIGTEFQMMVWDILLEIPYGTTTTYGDIAAKIAARCGRASMSSQAVGNAVGHNPISIIVPCHRVVGSQGQLTGYAGGLERKRSLLKLEGAIK